MFNLLYNYLYNYVNLYNSSVAIRSVKNKRKKYVRFFVRRNSSSKTALLFLKKKFFFFKFFTKPVTLLRKFFSFRKKFSFRYLVRKWRDLPGYMTLPRRSPLKNIYYKINRSRMFISYIWRQFFQDNTISSFIKKTSFINFSKASIFNKNVVYHEINFNLHDMLIFKNNIFMPFFRKAKKMKNFFKRLFFLSKKFAYVIFKMFARKKPFFRFLKKVYKSKRAFRFYTFWLNFFKLVHSYKYGSNSNNINFLKKIKFFSFLTGLVIFKKKNKLDIFKSNNTLSVYFNLYNIRTYNWLIIN